MTRFGLLVIVGMLSGCQWISDSPRGFSLPEGDADAGKNAFVNYGCVGCHAVEGLEMGPEHTYVLPQPITLSSRTSNVRTYGELVTSIINPSHKLAPRYPVSLTADEGGSKMANLNDTLTVTDLVNLVAFLQPKFEVKPHRTSEYRLYKLRQADKAED